VELFEAIRREYVYGTGTIQGVSRKLGVHPADGSASPGKCDSAGAEAASTKPSEFGAVMEFNRRDSDCR